MAAPMIVLGSIGYALAGFVYSHAPTVTQEIASLLIATNASLFFVGGIVVAAIAARAPG